MMTTSDLIILRHHGDKPMGSVIHETVPVQVWIDVDMGIADVVRCLTEMPGIRCHSSCQGTIGEGGPEPYAAYVLVTWDDDEAYARLVAGYDVSIEGDHWGYAHPR